MKKCLERRIEGHRLYVCTLEAGHRDDHAEVRWADSYDPIDDVRHSWPRTTEGA